MYTTYQPKQITIGENSIKEIGKIAKNHNITHLFVVLDKFLTTENLNYDEKIRGFLSTLDSRVLITR